MWKLGEEEITPDYFNEAAGYDSYLVMFSLGLPMYYFFICIFLIALSIVLRILNLFLFQNESCTDKIALKVQTF